VVHPLLIRVYSCEFVVPSSEYHGPIYAFNDLEPDQVIANVQTTLQQPGYYRGPINGELDPATQDAIANYQRDHGLYATSAIGGQHWHFSAWPKRSALCAMMRNYW